MVAGGVRLRLLERPAWGVAEDGGAGEGDGAIPLGNEEAAGGVGMGAAFVAVLAAEGGFDFAKGFSLFHAGLALPVKSETLATDAAARLNRLVAAFAKYLHDFCPPICQVSPGHN